MRLYLILPSIEPTEINPPHICPFKDCRGKQIRHFQTVDKALQDTIHDEVRAERYICLQCRRTFRVYPRGVTHSQTSQRIKAMGTLLYLAGLSYGATSHALEALGIYLSKSSIYEAVHTIAQEISGLKQNPVFTDIKASNLENRSLCVRYNAHWLPLRLTVNNANQLALIIERLSSEDAEIIKNQL